MDPLQNLRLEPSADGKGRIVLDGEIIGAFAL